MKENILIDKSIAFAARIIKLHDFLIKNKRGLIIAKQVIRSGTGMLLRILFLIWRIEECRNLGI